jgi:hypothetical protein
MTLFPLVSLKGLIVFNLLNVCSVRMNTLHVRAVADLLLSAQTKTKAMAMAHYNIVELARGIETEHFRERMS